MKYCHYCMQPIIGDALEVDGVFFHPQCHKDAVLEICYFCDNVDRDCPADCGFLAYATQYLEEEEKEWSGQLLPVETGSLSLTSDDGAVGE